MSEQARRGKGHMKISQEHYAYMRDAISGVVEKAGRKELAAFKETQKTERQFRWNLLWAAKISMWISDTLYPLGVKDDHIDTALRKIVAELGV
jgi:hypothetical protein